MIHSDASRRGACVFRKLLAEASKASQTSPKLWAFIAYDQLSDQMGPLAEYPVHELGIVLIESEAKSRRRPYHRRKLALILANMRHFAVEQAQRGVSVRYVMTSSGYRDALKVVIKDTGPLLMMEPAEREMRRELADLVKDGSLNMLPHEGWLTTTEDFSGCASSGPSTAYRMDAFYRAIRRRTGFLMTQDGKPNGGRFSFDGENRQAWPGKPAEPILPLFESTIIKQEVCDLVNSKFSGHPGVISAKSLPTTLADSLALWEWAKSECLPSFGPFEDAMSTKARRLFHTKISELLNIHRLLPRTVVQDVLSLDLPLPSKEGFLRQVLGWREFVRHVHLATDGFRSIGFPNSKVRTKSVPGDAGFSKWSKAQWKRLPRSGGDGGAQPGFLGAEESLPAAFWGTASGLNCLDTVIAEVWEEGYSHHITRLMILSNLATLLDVAPRQLADWFWVAYSDAYDWVVEPNVLGMGSFSAGPVMTTKPYISGAAYIDRMSDYCKSCQFHPKKNCPVTPMYWHFLRSKESKLNDNQRLAMPLAAMRRRKPEQVARDQAMFAHVTSVLQSGHSLDASDEVFKS